MGRRRGCIGKNLMGFVGLTQRILGGKESLCGSSVPFPFGILFKGVTDADTTIAEILSVHGLYGRV